MQREWRRDELVGSWTLVGADRRLVGSKSGSTRGPGLGHGARELVDPVLPA